MFNSTYATMLQLKLDCRAVWRYKLFRTIAGSALLFSWRIVQREKKRKKVLHIKNKALKFYYSRKFSPNPKREPQQIEMKGGGTNLNYYTHSSAVTFIPDITYTFQYLHITNTTIVGILNASIMVLEKS